MPYIAEHIQQKFLPCVASQWVHGETISSVFGVFDCKFYFQWWFLHCVVVVVFECVILHFVRLFRPIVGGVHIASGTSFFDTQWNAPWETLLRHLGILKFEMGEVILVVISVHNSLFKIIRTTACDKKSCCDSEKIIPAIWFRDIYQFSTLRDADSAPQCQSVLILGVAVYVNIKHRSVSPVR